MLDFDYKVENPDVDPVLKIIGGDEHAEELLSLPNLSKEELTEAKKKINRASSGNVFDGLPINWLAKHPNLWGMYMQHLEKWVKYDEATKRIVFLTALSAYSHNPINLFLRGPSSTGKTYVSMQSLKYFPKKDIWLLGGLSPTALIHDYGVFVDDTGKELNLEDIEWKKGGKTSWKQVVDLTGKILVFLEAPNIGTYNTLRPILSHDAWEIEYKFADRSKKGSLVTRKVFIRGWPACIFCTVDTSYREELSTRSINMTPEMSEAKYEAANLMLGERLAEPWKYANPDRVLDLFQNSLLEVREKIKKYEAIIPYAKELARCYQHNQPRDMRDLAKLGSLIQQITLFHIFQRPWLENATYEGRKIVFSVLPDFYEAIKLFIHVAETTRSGLPGNVVSFFNEVMFPLDKEFGLEISYDNIIKKWSEVYKTTRSRDVLKRLFLIPLSQAGWIDEYPNPDDRRRVCIQVLHRRRESFIIGDEFERQFNDLWNEKRMEKWVESARKEYSESKVMIGGKEVAWEEFPYRYFMEWNPNAS